MIKEENGCIFFFFFFLNFFIEPTVYSESIPEKKSKFRFWKISVTKKIQGVPL